MSDELRSVRPRPRQTDGLPAERPALLVRLLRRTQTVAFGLILGIVTAAVSVGIDLLSGDAMSPARLVAAVISVPVLAVLFWVSLRISTRIERRRSRKSFNPTSRERALKLGRPPALAETEEWVPKLRKLRALEKWEAVGGTILFLAFSGLGVYLFVSGAARAVVGALITVVFLVFAVWSPFYYGRRGRRIDRLIRAFEERADDDAR